MRVLFVTNMYRTQAEPWFGCFVEDGAGSLVDLGVL